MTSIAPATVSNLFEAFGAAPEDVRAAMGIALANGGEACDLYFEAKRSCYIGAEDGEVNRANTHTDLGVGLRVICGEQVGYSHTEEIDRRSLCAIAETAGAIAASSHRAQVARFGLQSGPSSTSVYGAVSDAGMKAYSSVVETLNAHVARLDSRIVKCNVHFNDELRHILIVRSDGLVTSDIQPMTSVYVRCVAENQGRREEGFFGISGRHGLEVYAPEVLERIAREAVRRTVLMFEADSEVAGQMPIVLAPGPSGILLHEAIGHGLEADFIRRGVSLFAGRLGDTVARNFVSIADDGTNQNLRGSIAIDDEGNPAESTMLVENGVLRSYLHDSISAKHFGVAPTGSGRRESFRFAPMPRMRNTYLLNGPHEAEEIIQSVKTGIYAEEFTNGEVLIGAGDFSFFVKQGYLIENGRLTRPIKDVNVTGNGPEVLANITMVGRDLAFSEGASTCGKDGQAVPVQMGVPTVKVEWMNVGGVSS